MCDALDHRGPDDRGYYWDREVALGHCRLAIIDVAGGKQPMANEDGTVLVTFNGEIYNYTELRGELSRAGHRFGTATDTEVLVHLYEEVGEQLPEHLNGMFAFALWDARKRQLLLARDRFGEKPLYYSRSLPGFRFCFASELKALLSQPGFAPVLEPRSVANFLSLGYIPDPDTIFKQVLKLRPAHSLLVTPSGDHVRRYWQPSFTMNGPCAIGAAVEELRETAGDSVARRMMSDVPLGAFLSGGLDSSSVVAMMSAQTSAPVKTFSIGFADDRFDERRYASIVAERFQTEHHERIVTESIHEMLATLVEQYDEPFGDSSAIPSLCLAKLTREHVTVGLSGDGADEIFGGYRRYFRESTKHRARILLPQPLRRLMAAVSLAPVPRYPKALLQSVAGELGDSYFTIMSGFRDRELAQVLSPELRRDLGGYSPREDFRGRFRRVAHLPALHQLQAVDLDTYLPGDILVKVDRATMAHSLESRAPWLDHRLAELAFRLPVSLKLHGTTGKYVLKEAMRRTLPPPVISRRKMGFSVPLSSWMRSALRPVFDSTVISGEMAEYFSVEHVRTLWREPINGTLLWYLLILGLWHQRWRRGLPYRVPQR
jgi:asparagine synthase (glutamine-hydrolysing)